MGHPDTCGACHGTGRGVNPETQVETGYNCVLCNGSGQFALELDCGFCDGAGSQEIHCESCGGSGAITVIHETVEENYP
jgi:DnaJ-class molecular chaperone